MQPRPLRPRSSRRSRRRAFTLLEIIVVVTIIALLGAMVAPKLLGQIGNSKKNLAKNEVQQIANQVSIWMANNGYDTIPNDFRLEELAEGESRVLNADDLMDPWENPYQLVFPPEVNPDFDIRSYGPDGQPGGDDDIVN